MADPKTILIGVAVVIILALIGVYAYTAYASVNDSWPWQLTFFFVVSIVSAAAISGVISYKVGKGMGALA